jgi:hypothetical protein
VTDKRQTYRIILQFMTYISVAILLSVLFNSVFIGNDKQTKTPTGTIEMSLQQLVQGKLTHVLWQGKNVSILHRNDVMNISYFVYYNLGDSGNCPLFFNGKFLKDTCTGTQYSQAGEAINKGGVDDLTSPPHYFIAKQQKVIIGMSQLPSVEAGGF